MKYNLKNFLMTLAKEKKKTCFKALLPDVEMAMEPLVEATVRDNFDRELKRAARRALADDDEKGDLQQELFTVKETEHE